VRYAVVQEKPCSILEILLNVTKYFGGESGGGGMEPIGLAKDSDTCFMASGLSNDLLSNFSLLVDDVCHL
jgi:hypothetical protein